MALTSLAATENSFRALWGRPQYPSFLLTVSLSRMIATMFNTAGVLLILERTGSAPLAGITAAAAVVPAALTGPALGAWLDVARRRRALIVFGPQPISDTVRRAFPRRTQDGRAAR
jgi:hypothetical protein